jgi:hypothetical protein
LQPPKSAKHTIAVLLPCRERGSRTTKQWLRRLQNYLSASHKGNATKSVRIVTLFTCRARDVFASLDFANLFSGILSFEPRKIGGGPEEEIRQQYQVKTMVELVAEIVLSKQIITFFK